MSLNYEILRQIDQEREHSRSLKLRKTHSSAEPKTLSDLVLEMVEVPLNPVLLEQSNCNLW